MRARAVPCCIRLWSFSNGELGHAVAFQGSAGTLSSAAMCGQNLLNAGGSVALVPRKADERLLDGSGGPDRGFVFKYVRQQLLPPVYGCPSRRSPRCICDACVAEADLLVSVFGDSVNTDRSLAVERDRDRRAQQIVVAQSPSSGWSQMAPVPPCSPSGWFPVSLVSSRGPRCRPRDRTMPRSVGADSRRGARKGPW